MRVVRIFSTLLFIMWEYVFTVNTTGCNNQPASPVCDTDGRTHINPCHLVMSGRMLAYWGPCLQGCSAVSLFFYLFWNIA